MKKLVYILSCLFLLSAGFAACSCESEDPPEQPNSHQNETPVDSTVIKNNSSKVDSTGSYTVISPVEVSEEVKAFFDEALPSPDIYRNVGETDFKMDIEQYADHAGWPVYHVINDVEELHERYIGDSVVPEIDLDNYTLIIGHCLTGTPHPTESGYFGINILNYTDHYELNIMEENYYYYGGPNLSYFWGLFPKIQGYFIGFTWNYEHWY